MPLIALTRPVPDSVASCELTHQARVPIDVDVARAQHAEYERALEALGCEVRPLPAADDYPDSVFVEDTAIVLDELAVITRPGAISRRGEIVAIAAELSRYRRLEWVSEPATVDGGDVLRLDRTLYVGVGSRTNEAGVAQLLEIVQPFEYDVRAVRVTECLHLKSAVTELGPDLVLLNPDWVDPSAFAHHRRIEVDPLEPTAANVLRIGETVLCASSYERTRRRIEAAGIGQRSIDGSELAKAEGGLTCCSLIFRESSESRARRAISRRDTA
jgi:dimethylargininase